jgi:hypothetical protein
MRKEEQGWAEELNPAELGYASSKVPWAIKLLWVLYFVGAATYLVIVLS